MGENTDKSSTEQFRLLKAIIHNDEAVLRRLYQDNYAAVRTYVVSNQGTTDDANDVYQEAFIAMWRNVQLNRFVPENAGALQAYLHRIAKNKWIDHLRAVKKRRTIPIPGEEDVLASPDRADDGQEQFVGMVKEKLALLGTNCQNLLNRYYYLRQTLKQIALDMAWTEQTAKNNKYRCMERLRQMVNANR